MTILQKITASVHAQLETKKQLAPITAMAEQAQSIHKGFRFEQTLSDTDISFICEVKKASPSKGIIAQDFPYVSIAREYEEAGASALSVLTEPEFFLGSPEYLKEISQTVTIPILRKDFIIDPWQIYETALMGADALLLICSILDQRTLADFIHLADTMGLSALVEVHDEAEMDMALQSGARILGVNNRNLKDFSVDLNNSIRLRHLVPNNILFVAESGISSPQDMKLLQENRVNAVLIGETLMRAKNKREMLQRLKGAETPDQKGII